MVKQLEKYSKNSSEVRTLLNPLSQIAKKVVGDESSGQLLEECAIWLLLFFLDKENVGPKDVTHLKANFGNADLALAKNILKVYENFYSHI